MSINLFNKYFNLFSLLKSILNRLTFIAKENAEQAGQI